jgi:prevent-host-death family protein
MKIASVADVKAQFSAYLRESERGPVVVTRNGKPVGLLLGATDEDELERLILLHSPRFQRLIEKSRKQIRERKGIPLDQFWAELDAEYDEAPPPKSRKPIRKPKQLSTK